MDELIKLNPNLLETNLINIVLLLALLLYLTKSSFSANLAQRENEIAQSLNKIEKDILTSLSFYEKTEESIKFAYLYLQEWKSLYQKEKESLISTKYQDIKENLEDIFKNTENLLQNFETNSKAKLEKYLILLVSGKLLRKFFFLPKEEKSKIIKEILLNLQ